MRENLKIVVENFHVSKNMFIWPPIVLKTPSLVISDPNKQYLVEWYWGIYIPTFCWEPGGTRGEVSTDPGTAVVWGPGGTGGEVSTDPGTAVVWGPGGRGGEISTDPGTAVVWGPGGTGGEVSTDPGTAVVWGPGRTGGEVSTDPGKE